MPPPSAAVPSGVWKKGISATSYCAWDGPAQANSRATTAGSVILPKLLTNKTNSPHILILLKKVSRWKVRYIAGYLSRAVHVAVDTTYR